MDNPIDLGYCLSSPIHAWNCILQIHYRHIKTGQIRALSNSKDGLSSWNANGKNNKQNCLSALNKLILFHYFF